MLVQNITQLIGNTPTLKLNNYTQKNDLKANIYAKLEYQNPFGSIKDRIALSMITTASQTGELAPGGTIIEATSSHLGVSIAAIGANMGYKVIIVMPQGDHIRTEKAILAYGGEIIYSPKEKGITGAIKKAKELSSSTKDAYFPNQFFNPSNPQAHRITTVHEILSDVPNIDMFVCAIETGGTITGVGNELKQFNENCEIIGVVPVKNETSFDMDISSTQNTLNKDIIDNIIPVNIDDAKSAVTNLSTTEGVYACLLSGAVLFAATTLAKLPQNANKNIVIILPEAGKKQ